MASERVQRQIDRLLDQIEEAANQLSWDVVIERSNAVLAYDPENGDEDGGIAPGISFEDLPDDWVCPICGAGKSDFEPE